MKLSKSNKHILVHAIYTALIIMTGLAFYDGGTIVQTHLNDAGYFTDQPILNELVIRSIHLSGVFIFDIIILTIIYKYYDVLL